VLGGEAAFEVGRDEDQLVNQAGGHRSFDRRGGDDVHGHSIDHQRRAAGQRPADEAGVNCKVPGEHGECTGDPDQEKAIDHRPRSRGGIIWWKYSLSEIGPAICSAAPISAAAAIAWCRPFSGTMRPYQTR